MNHRPLGYEPNELPDCSIPRYFKAKSLAEGVGFEPTRDSRHKLFSRQPRYDHFGTPPLCTFSAQMRGATLTLKETLRIQLNFKINAGWQIKAG